MSVDRTPVADFIASMEAAGIRPVEAIADKLGDGNLIRFRAEGDRAGRANAWAVLHLDDRPAGAFGSYRLGITETWRSGVRTPMSASERQAARKRWDDQRAARIRDTEAAQAGAAVYAEQVWGRAGVADPAHPYLARKRIAAEGIRQDGDNLIVPMRDALGLLWNVQRIAPDGGKRFLKGGRVDGLLWLVGDPAECVAIGEGMATMAAIRRATGMAVVAAFSAKNLEPVARAVRGRWPESSITIAADDDAHLLDHPTIKRNLGLDAAVAAAAAVGASIAMPPEGAR